MFGAKKRNSVNISGQPGQIAVVVLLIMAALLVLGLSVASRTTQEIELSDQEQDSTRVFNAAETGIEEALSDTTHFTTADGGTTVQNSISNLSPSANVTGSYTITRQDGLQTKVIQGSTATVFLDQFSGSSFDISWAKEANCDSRASIIYSINYNEGGTEKVQYQAIKPNCVGYNLSKAPGFTNAADGSGGYYHKTTVNLSAIPGTKKMVRIKPVYADADISISSVPAQAYDIRSEATDTSESNGEKSAIQVTRTKPAPPAIFDYAIYSGGDLQK